MGQTEGQEATIAPVIDGSTAVFGFTFTDEQDVVVAEAHRTFTAEAPDLVDANSVGADAGDLSALVDI